MEAPSEAASFRADSIQDLEQAIDDLLEFNEDETREQWQDRVEEEEPKITERLNKLAQEGSDPATIAFLKGKLLNIIEDYDEKAEEFLKEATTLSPKNSVAWITLGDVLWKKEDFNESRKCFETALACSEKPDKVALQKLSMVLRKIGETDEEKQANTLLSIEKAKMAVALDVKDGDSWYVLGNSHLTNFFFAGLSYDLKGLQNALVAYKQAEKTIYGVNKIDMYQNRATVYRYLEDYPAAITDFSLALALDPSWDLPVEAMEEIVEMLASIKQLTEKKLDTLPAKKRTQMLESLPAEGKRGDFNITTIDALTLGPNKGACVVAKVMGFVTNPTGIPVIATIIDAKSNCVAVSIYNISDDVLAFGDELFVANLVLRETKLEREGEVAIEYKSILVERPTTITVNGKPIQREDIAMSTVTLGKK